MNYFSEANTAVESYLNRNKVPYRLEHNIPLKLINRRKGLVNNARMIPGQIDEDTVTRYAIALLDGATFPAGVVIKNCRGYDPLDFNHRLSGLDGSGLVDDDTTVSAYVIETDDQAVIDGVTRGLNTTNGLPHSAEERVQHAVAMCEKFPSLSKAAVAKQFGITAAGLSSALKVKQTAVELREMGIASERLSHKALLKIAQLGNDAPVMAKVAESAIRNDLSKKDVDELVDTVKSKRSESTKLDAVENFSQSLIKYAPKTRERIDSPKPGFFRSLHALWGAVSKFPTLEHLHLTSKSEIEEARRDWLKLREHMDGIFG